MNTAKQFLALFKFQSTINPFIWLMPVAFGTPLLIPLMNGFMSGKYHPSFSILLGNQNLFFIGIFGAMILAPEKYQLGAANVACSYFGSEFLITRAIDRPVLYRAKSALLYILVLLLPLIGIAQSLRNPDLVVDEYEKSVQQLCLAQVPGSTLLPPENKRHSSSTIAIPNGSVLIAEWQFGIFVAATMMLQWLMLLLYPFRFGRGIFWVIFFGLILVPLFDLTHVGRDEPTINDQLFFSFAAHQSAMWMLTAFGFVLTQLWCERRFAQLEQ